MSMLKLPIIMRKQMYGYEWISNNIVLIDSYRSEIWSIHSFYHLKDC